MLAGRWLNVEDAKDVEDWGGWVRVGIALGRATCGVVSKLRDVIGAALGFDDSSSVKSPSQGRAFTSCALAGRMTHAKFGAGMGGRVCT